MIVFYKIHHYGTNRVERYDGEVIHHCDVIRNCAVCRVELVSLNKKVSDEDCVVFDDTTTPPTHISGRLPKDYAYSARWLNNHDFPRIFVSLVGHIVDVEGRILMRGPDNTEPITA